MLVGRSQEAGKSYFIIRHNLAWIFTYFPDRAIKAQEYITERLRSGRFSPKIGEVFPLDQIKEAYDHLRSEELMGRVILIPGV